MQGQQPVNRLAQLGKQAEKRARQVFSRYQVSAVGTDRWPGPAWCGTIWYGMVWYGMDTSRYENSTQLPSR